MTTHKNQVGQTGANGNGGEFAKKTQSTDGVALPAPHQPGVYGGYQVAALNMLSNGAFEAQLYRDGKLVLIVENDGRGGSHRLVPAGPGLSGEIKRLDEFGKKVFGDDAFEPADQMFNFLAEGMDLDSIAHERGWDREFAAEAYIRQAQEDNAGTEWENDSNILRGYELLRHPEQLDEIAASL